MNDAQRRRRFRDQSYTLTPNDTPAVCRCVGPYGGYCLTRLCVLTADRWKDQPVGADDVVIVQRVIAPRRRERTPRKMG